VRQINNFAVCFGRQRTTRELVGAVLQRGENYKQWAGDNGRGPMNNERRAWLEVGRRQVVRRTFALFNLLSLIYAIITHK
jgi:hypothetical protein